MFAKERDEHCVARALEQRRSKLRTVCAREGTHGCWHSRMHARRVGYWDAGCKNVSDPGRDAMVYLLR